MPSGTQFAEITPSTSKNTISIILYFDLLWRTFSILGDDGIFQRMNCLLVSAQVIMFARSSDLRQVAAKFQHNILSDVLSALVWRLLESSWHKFLSCSDPQAKFSTRCLLMFTYSSNIWTPIRLSFRTICLYFLHFLRFLKYEVVQDVHRLKDSHISRRIIWATQIHAHET